MFKKYRLIVALLVVGLLSGGFLHTVDASASVGNDNSEWNSNSSEKQYNNDWQGFFKKYFSKWNIQWDFENNSNQQASPKVERTEDNQSKENQVNQNNNQVNQQVVQNKQSENSKNDQEFLSQFEQQVVTLTNNERAKYGLSPLKADWELSRVAKEKSRDMLIYNYFDHNSPIYGSPFDMMDAYMIHYRSAGENIAKGQRSPEEVVNAWMNSEGHRANILNGSFTHIGVGFSEDGYIWTQQFIGK